MKRNLRHGFVDKGQMKAICQNKLFPIYTSYIFALQNWNVNNSIEKGKVDFSIVFYDKD